MKLKPGVRPVRPRKLILDKRLLKPRPRKKEQILTGSKEPARPTWGGSNSISHWERKVAEQARINEKTEREIWAREYAQNPLVGTFASWKAGRRR